MRLSAALLVAAVSTAATTAAELRGVWVVRTALTSAGEVDRVVDQAADAGMNALFVQVRGRGDAFYASRLVPRSDLIRGNRDFDPLARLIERARGRGLAVHAWINVLLTAHFGVRLPPGHVIAAHPDWIMVPRGVARPALGVEPGAIPGLVLRASRGDPDVEGYYLSPSAPGVGAHLEAVVREIVRSYAVDGFHLDFIRYPSREYDYSRAALEAFARDQDVDGDPLAAAAARPEAWDEYRREALTRLADVLVRAARYERPGVIVSAAVVPDEEFARQERYQSWPSWLAKGLLDAVCPMTYTPDTRVFRSQLDRARALVGHGRELWAGVGAYRLSFDGVVEKVRAARASGASGVVLFSHESLSPGDWRRLREALTPTLAASAAAAIASPADGSEQ
jgi:uncharacterized lipoprotein YddW (UPF0748 family)